MGTVACIFKPKFWGNLKHIDNIEINVANTFMSVISDGLKIWNTTEDSRNDCKKLLLHLKKLFNRYFLGG